MEFSEFADLPVIDCHAHFKRGVKSLEELVSEGETLIEVIRRGRLRQIYITGEYAGLYLKVKYPGLFYAGGRVPAPYVDGIGRNPVKDWDRYIDELIEVGFDGIGELVSKPAERSRRIPLNSQYYEGFWDKCESAGYAVLCHVADPEEFWDERLIPEWAREKGWGYYHGDFPSKEELYAEMHQILDEHPRLKIVLCHFYFISADLEKAEGFLNQYKNANLDLALGVELMYNISRRRDDWRSFFIKHQDRILFGTDIGVSQTLQEHLDRVWLLRNFLESDEEFYTPETADPLLTRYREPYVGLNLPRHVLWKIYAGNFMRLWGEKPRDVDLEMAIAKCEERGERFIAEALRGLTG